MGVQVSNRSFVRHGRCNPHGAIWAYTMCGQSDIGRRSKWIQHGGRSKDVTCGNCRRSKCYKALARCGGA